MALFDGRRRRGRRFQKPTPKKDNDPNFSKKANNSGELCTAVTPSHYKNMSIWKPYILKNDKNVSRFGNYFRNVISVRYIEIAWPKKYIDLTDDVPKKIEFLRYRHI